MHALKLIGLIVLYLLILRVLSWGISWVVRRVFRTSARTTALVANVAAFGFYIGFLYWDRIPGDSIDPAAVIAGAVVYLVYFAVDVWRGRRTKGAQA